MSTPGPEAYDPNAAADDLCSRLNDSRLDWDDALPLIAAALRAAADAARAEQKRRDAGLAKDWARECDGGGMTNEAFRLHCLAALIEHGPDGRGVGRPEGA